MSKWEDYYNKKKKEEEEKADREKSLPAADDSGDIWTAYQNWKKTGELPEPRKAEPEPEPEEEEPKSLTDRLAARGITVEMPSEKKTPEDTAYTAEDQYGFQSLRPSLTGEGSALTDTAGKNAFTSRIWSTATAAEERTKQLTAQLEDARKDETVRNEEWLSSLRSKEEIEKDLEEAKEAEKKAKGAERKDTWLTRIANAVNQQYVLPETKEDEGLKAESSAASERRQALEDELAERTWADYERLRNNPDFKEKSQYQSTATGKEVKVGLTGIDARGAYEDPLYDYINGDTDAKWALERNKKAGVRQNAQYDTAVAQNAEGYTQYSYLTNNEKSLYNYIHATEGAEKANEYLAYLMSDLYERQATKEKEMAAQWADQNGLTRAASTVGSVLASPMKGSAYIGQAAEMLTTGKVDENAPYNRAAYIPNELRSTVSKDIERNWGKWGSFAYNTGMSMLDFLWNSAVSGGSEALSLALMGTGAAADATMAAKERGLDDKTAFVLGTIAGAAEIASEKVSIEALFKSADWKSAPVKYILQNFFFEGAEEVESDAINWLADAIVARDKSEWMDDIRAYQKDNPGASENKAFWNAVWKRVKEGGLDFLGGAISGGVMAGTRVAGANILDTAKKSSDRSADIESTRRATAAIRNLGQNQAQQTQEVQPVMMMPTPEQAEAGQGPTVIPQAQPTQEETELDRIINEGFAESWKFGEGELIRVRTPEEVMAAQNASEAAQGAKANPEGISLLTAEEAETAQAAKMTRSAETETKAEAQELRFGTEPEVRTMTPTVEEAEINDAVQNAEDAGNITRATGIRYGVDEKTIKKAENYGRLTGNTVEFYKGQAKNGTIENGFVDKRNRRIYYNVDAKQPFQFTVGHEFTHTLEGTREYADLADHVKTRAAEQGKDWEAMREDIREVYERSGHGTLTDAEIDEELVADWIGENLSDEKTIREICRETPSAAKKLRDALDQLVIKAANMTGTLSPYEAEKMQNVIGLYDKYLGRAEEARRNAQPQAVPAQQQAQNAQPAAESVQTEKNTKEWKSWENAGRELTDKWSGINSGEFVAALEELYAAASENAPRTQDGKIDPAQVDYNAVPVR